MPTLRRLTFMKLLITLTSILVMLRCGNLGVSDTDKKTDKIVGTPVSVGETTEVVAEGTTPIKEGQTEAKIRENIVDRGTQIAADAQFIGNAKFFEASDTSQTTAPAQLVAFLQSMGTDDAIEAVVKEIEKRIFIHENLTIVNDYQFVYTLKPEQLCQSTNSTTVESEKPTESKLPIFKEEPTTTNSNTNTNTTVTTTHQDDANQTSVNNNTNSNASLIADTTTTSAVDSQCADLINTLKAKIRLTKLSDQRFRIGLLIGDDEAVVLALTFDEAMVKINLSVKHFPTLVKALSEKEVTFFGNWQGEISLMLTKEAAKINSLTLGIEEDVAMGFEVKQGHTANIKVTQSLEWLKLTLDASNETIRIGIDNKSTSFDVPLDLVDYNFNEGAELGALKMAFGKLKGIIDMAVKSDRISIHDVISDDDVLTLLHKADVLATFSLGKGLDTMSAEIIQTGSNSGSISTKTGFNGALDLDFSTVEDLVNDSNTAVTLPKVHVQFALTGPGEIVSSDNKMEVKKGTLTFSKDTESYTINAGQCLVKNDANETITVDCP